ncbi:hypothetical protein A2U01_0068353 [Trifolium medium]|uniref:Uncharacterized protein n=1 Tax=Trifolium medium TaxID=97028 RepID=A0A392SF93_9FABA|nr:hypothetical protein [Trifolium medium]
MLVTMTACNHLELDLQVLKFVAMFVLHDVMVELLLEIH